MGNEPDEGVSGVGDEFAPFTDPADMRGVSEPDGSNSVFGDFRAYGINGGSTNDLSKRLITVYDGCFLMVGLETGFGSRDDFSFLDFRDVFCVE